MKRTNIYLDEELDRLLRHLAVEEGRSFTGLVRDVLLDYVRRRGFDIPSRVRPPITSVHDPRWREEFLAALANLRADAAEELSSDEIERLITEASEEARQERLAQQVMADDG